MIHRERRGDTSLLRLEHGKANALDVELCTTLHDAIDEAAADPSTRALVLSGTGTIFSAGVDLFRLLDGGSAYIDAFVPTMIRTFLRLFTLPQPAVAAINGHAIAGGCVLAAACDYRIMADGTGRIGVPELQVGVPFPLEAIEILRFATSTAHLQELVYRGKTYAPDAAYDLGLIDEVTDADGLLDNAFEVAARLSSEPAARFRITKRQLRHPTLDRIERHAADTAAEVISEWKDPETQGAIRAYIEGIQSRRG